MNRSKSSKVEKLFYKKSNFQLLSDVIKDAYPNRDQLPPNYQEIILNMMGKIFTATKIPKNIHKDQRHELVQSLNKQVLTEVSSMFQSRRFSQESDSREISPAFMSEQERKMQLTRPISPRKKPALHPSMNINEFPRPQAQDSRKSNQPTNIAFQQMEENRAQMFSSSKQRENIDFSLPEMQEDLPDPQAKLEQMMKEREAEDRRIQQQRPSSNNQENEVSFASTRERSIQQMGHKDTTKSLWPGSSGYMPSHNQDQGAAAFTQDTFVQGLDEKLLSGELDNRTTQYVTSERKQQQRVIVANEQQNVIANEFTRNQQQNVIANEFTRNQQQNVIANEFTREQQQQRVPEVHEKLLTLSSIAYSYKSADNKSFSVRVQDNTQPEEGKDMHGNTIYIYQPCPDSSAVSAKSLGNIVTVQCSDVTVPRSFRDALDEPYLWLHVDEWGAIARVRVLNAGHPGSKFLTLSPIEPREIHPSHLPETLTVRLIQPSGESCIVSEKASLIRSVQEDNSKVRLHLADKVPSTWQKNDVLYIRSTLPAMDEMVEFTRHVYFHSVKMKKSSTNKHTLTLKGYTVTEPETVRKNLIGTYRASDTGKTPINFYDFLRETDIFFLGLSDGTNHWCPITNVERSEKGSTLSLEYYSKVTPKNITRAGFLRRQVSGVTSPSNDDLHRSSGCRILDISENSVLLDYSFDNLDTLDKLEDTFIGMVRSQQVTVTFRLQTQTQI